MAEPDAEIIDEPVSNQLALDRTNLAHERTLMSWVRTAMSMITFGFTIYKFFQLELEVQHHPRLQDIIGPRQFAISMILIGLFSLVVATVQYRLHRNNLRRSYVGTPLLSLAGVVAALVSVLGLLALVAVVFRL